MTIRTLKFPLRYSPENSQTIGYLSSQQNAAYNFAVSLLNHEPSIPKRSGKDHPDALNKRITQWRQTNRKQNDAPYNIHQIGAEDAWKANQMLRKSREDRLQRIDDAIKNGKDIKHRDAKPHRRTLKFRSRKARSFGLNISDHKLLAVSDDYQSLTIDHRKYGFSVRLRGNASLQFLDIRSVQFVAVKQYAANTPFSQRHYCLHVQVAIPDPMPIEKLDIQKPDDILGGDRGSKNHLAVSSGKRAHHDGAKTQGKKRRKHQKNIAGKPKHSKRRQHAVTKYREQSRRHYQHRDQQLRWQMRNILLEAKPKMVAVESLKCISMMASARGTSDAPSKNVNAKKKLNESLAEAAIGHIGKLLREEAAKLGIPTVSVPPQGTSLTCPRCNCWHSENRESQAEFRCRNCGLYAHADWTASVIVRNRAYVRYCEWLFSQTPRVETTPTGWKQQPSDPEWQPMLLPPGYSVFKLEGSETSPCRTGVRGPKPESRMQAAFPDAQSVTNSEPANTVSNTAPAVPRNPITGHQSLFVNTL